MYKKQLAHGIRLKDKTTKFLKTKIIINPHVKIANCHGGK